jgi:hypothetical protein
MYKRQIWGRYRQRVSPWSGRVLDIAELTANFGSVAEELQEDDGEGERRLVKLGSSTYSCARLASLAHDAVHDDEAHVISLGTRCRGASKVSLLAVFNSD